MPFWVQSIGLCRARGWFVPKKRAKRVVDVHAKQRPQNLATKTRIESHSLASKSSGHGGLHGERGHHRAEPLHHRFGGLGARALGRWATGVGALGGRQL